MRATARSPRPVPRRTKRQGWRLNWAAATTGSFARRVMNRSTQAIQIGNTLFPFRMIECIIYNEKESKITIIAKGHGIIIFILSTQE